MLKTLAVLSVLHAAPAAGSISGTWQIKGDISGYALNDVCAIEQKGTVLSGTCTLEGREPSALKGEVKDGKLIFSHTVRGDDGTSTLIFSASLSSPTSLEGTVTVKEYDYSGQFTATRGAAKQ